MSSTEFQLAVECCRWSFSGTGEDGIQQLCASADCAKLLRVARFHRVQGLVWSALGAFSAIVPSALASVLAEDARAIAANNLRMATEARDLRSSFEQAGVGLLFVKGLTVGALAYPKPMLKMAWDIDLLIDQSDVAQAAHQLSANGYELEAPAPSTDLASWHAHWKESVWSKPEGFWVELHTRLADNRRLIPSIDVNSPRQEVQVVRGISLPTFADDELFAYLAVHGASSAWFRLKWVADFAALCHRRDAEEISRLYYRSQELGAGRAAGQALLLSDDLFGTLVRNGDLRRSLARDRATRHLSGAALTLLAKETAEPTDRRGGTLPIHLTQFLLLPGLAYKLSELRRQVKGLTLQSTH